MSDYRTIIYEVRDQVVFVTLNRPEKRNAMSTELLAELDDALSKAERATGVRIIVVQGAGPSFCAGYDLSPAGSYDGPTDMMAGRAAELPNLRRWFRMLDLGKPIVAKVHGHAVAGGTELAMLCDLVIATEDSQFGYPIVRGTGTAPTLIFPWVIGMRMSNELLFTGRLISGREAAELHMINRAVPADQLDAELQALLDSMLATPPDLMELIKAGIQQQYEIMGMRAGLRTALELHFVGHHVQSVLEFSKIRQEQGLKPALAWRDNR